jgi:hypothetical protein
VGYDQFIAKDNLGVEMAKGTKVRISAFQEGQANDWECDWMESGDYTLGSSWPVDPRDKVTSTWALIKTD